MQCELRLRRVEAERVAERLFAREGALLGRLGADDAAENLVPQQPTLVLVHTRVALQEVQQSAHAPPAETYESVQLRDLEVVLF